MRRWGVWLLIGAAFAAAEAATSGASAALVTPTTHAGVLTARVGSKTSTYHLSTMATPVQVSVKGPIRLRILSRLVYPGSPPVESQPYALRVYLDGSEYRVLDETSGVSTKATTDDGRPLGTLERAVIPIPSGKHLIRIAPSTADRTVALRILTSPPKPKAKAPRTTWVAYAPEKYEQAIRLHVGDEETVYYRFNTHLGVAVSLRGSIRLKVRTRLDFSGQHGLTQSYVVRLFLDGKPWKSFSLTSRASHTGVYPDIPEVTPGVARDLTVKVPAGDHVITFELDGTTAERASLRLFVPEKELVSG